MRTTDTFTSGRAQQLRAEPTDAEGLLWARLRDRRLAGCKFVRQYPVGPYFADFACRERMLVVELDGSQHAESGYDARRDSVMNDAGFAMLRFWNEEIMRRSNEVCDTILAALDGSLAPFDRYKAPFSSEIGAAPHPPLRGTFSPFHGAKEDGDILP